MSRVGQRAMQLTVMIPKMMEGIGKGWHFREEPWNSSLQKCEGSDWPPDKAESTQLQAGTTSELGKCNPQSTELSLPKVVQRVFSLTLVWNTRQLSRLVLSLASPVPVPVAAAERPSCPSISAKTAASYFSDNKEANPFLLTSVIT